MSNSANADELRACIAAYIDLLVVWESQIEEVRKIAPQHFAGVGSTWAQFGSGKAGDVIMSFVADVCGEASEEGKPPKHAHAFGKVLPRRLV